jgi:hypothetical protein
MKPRDPFDLEPGSERTVWLVGLGAIIALLGLFILASVSFAGEKKPMPSFTEDCKPALEVLAKLMLEKHELPLFGGKVGEVPIIITRNPETKTATFLALCKDAGFELGTNHAPFPVPMVRVMFPFVMGDADLSSFPWVKA